MDRRSALITPRSVRAAQPDHVDQAIFTSIRSPVARGYRVVSASPGVSEDEQRELVQRAPSHANLTDPDDGAAAMAGFPMRTGRYAVLICRHAGPEPSGRGGWRVHTHAFLLPREVYGKLAFDPFRVEAFAHSRIEAGLRDPAVGAATSLAMPAHAGGRRSRTPAGPADEALPHALRLLEAGMSCDSFLVQGATDPGGLLAAILAALPAGLRFELSFSIGLKPSSQRAFRFVFGDPPPGEVERICEDQGYKLLTLGARTDPRPREASRSPFQPWIDWVGRQWRRGAIDDLVAVSDRLVSGCAPLELARTAALLDEIDHVGELSLEESQARLNACGDRETSSDIQRELLDRLKAALAERVQALTPAPAPESGAAQVEPTSGDASPAAAPADGTTPASQAPPVGPPPNRPPRSFTEPPPRPHIAD
jgi:hypothetical protein